jgi:hypothetical protein
VVTKVNQEWDQGTMVWKRENNQEKKGEETRRVRVWRLQDCKEEIMEKIRRCERPPQEKEREKH